MTTRGKKGRADLHLRLPPDLYDQIMLLAQENRRTVTAELTLAVECYLERAVRGSLRWHELAGEREATALAQELRQVRRDLTGEEPK